MCKFGGSSVFCFFIRIDFFINPYEIVKERILKFFNFVLYPVLHFYVCLLYPSNTLHVSCRLNTCIKVDISNVIYFSVHTLPAWHLDWVLEIWKRVKYFKNSFYWDCFHQYKDWGVVIFDIFQKEWDQLFFL